MKLTRFAQGCVLLEIKGKRILIDPGYLKWNQYLLTMYWTNIDILLVTHKHKDRFHEDSVREILKKYDAQFFTTSDVARAYPEFKPHIIEEGNKISFEDGFRIEVVKAVHGYVPLLNMNYVDENVGFIIDDGETRVYFAGDTISFPNKYKCDVVLVPVYGHGLAMGAFEASLFAKATGADLVIPVCYDHPKYPVSLEKVKQEFEKQKVNCKILELEESIKV